VDAVSSAPLCLRNAGINGPAALTEAAPLSQGSRQPARAPARPEQPREKHMDSNAVDGGHLRAFIERIEKLEEEKRAIGDDIKDVYAEAKGTGFDPKVMRKIVSLRRQDKHKRQEEEEILDLYLSALGME
jgi:uncharacterized protein (UPF0335 family)